MFIQNVLRSEIESLITWSAQVDSAACQNQLTGIVMKRENVLGISTCWRWINQFGWAWGIFFFQISSFKLNFLLINFSWHSRQKCPKFWARVKPQSRVPRKSPTRMYNQNNSNYCHVDQQQKKGGPKTWNLEMSRHVPSMAAKQQKNALSTYICVYTLVCLGHIVMSQLFESCVPCRGVY